MKASLVRIYWSDLQWRLWRTSSSATDDRTASVSISSSESKLKGIDWKYNFIARDFVVICFTILYKWKRSYVHCITMSLFCKKIWTTEDIGIKSSSVRGIMTWLTRSCVEIRYLFQAIWKRLQGVRSWKKVATLASLRTYFDVSCPWR